MIYVVDDAKETSVAPSTGVLGDKSTGNPVLVGVSTNAEGVLLAPLADAGPVRVAVAAKRLPLVVAPMLSQETLAEVRPPPHRRVCPCACVEALWCASERCAAVACVKMGAALNCRMSEPGECTNVGRATVRAHPAGLGFSMAGARTLRTHVHARTCARARTWQVTALQISYSERVGHVANVSETIQRNISASCACDDDRTRAPCDDR